jgi:hypothetical protein
LNEAVKCLLGFALLDLPHSRCICAGRGM